MALADHPFFKTRRWARRTLAVVGYTLWIALMPVVMVWLTINWLITLPREWLDGPFTEMVEFTVDFCRRVVAIWRK